LGELLLNRVVLRFAVVFSHGWPLNADAWDPQLNMVAGNGSGWLIRGIAQIVAAISDPAMPARGWQGFLGAIGVIAGIVLIDSPLPSIGLLTILGGCWLIALGVMELITAFRIRHHSNQVRSEV
jgi:hypothetical protein